MKNLFKIFTILSLTFLIGCEKSDNTDSDTRKMSEFVSGLACKFDL